MARLLWLADELRAAGLDVIEVDGWKTRGSDSFSPRGIVCHHTATPESRAGDYPSLGIVRDGRAGLPGPLSQLGLGRSGTVYVIASGRANHAGTGGWKGLKGNTSVLGIEAEDSGDGVWHSAQLAAYKTLCAALVRKMGISVSMVCGHKEWTSRKIDPAGINMDDFRAQVSDILTGTLPRTDEEDDPMMNLLAHGTGLYAQHGVFAIHLNRPQEVTSLQEKGLLRAGRAVDVNDYELGEFIILENDLVHVLNSVLDAVKAIKVTPAPQTVVHKLEIEAKVVD